MAGPLRDPGPQARRALSDLAADDGIGHAPDGPVAGAADAGAGAADDGPTGDGTEQPVEALPDAPVGALEEWSLDQLHRRASEVGLDGRWDMTRDELVVALRDPEQPTAR